MPRGSKKKTPSSKKSKPPATDKELFNSEDAAQYLNVTRGHIRKLASLGILVPEQTGGRDLIFKVHTLEDYRIKRLPRGRPIGSSASKSRSDVEREYMREYMRAWRKRGKKAGGKKSTARRGGARFIKK